MRMIDADALIDLINRAEIQYDINGDPPQENREQIFAHAWGMYKVIMEEMIYNQPTLTPPNEPLPLEQLREMDGEPVYCINIDDYSTKEWMIVGKDDCEGRRYIFDFSTYSRSWLAYRRPPEGEEDT